jgi:hypothetical protein
VYWAEKLKIDADNKWKEALAMYERVWNMLEASLNSGKPSRIPDETPPDIIRLRNKLKNAH